MRAIGPTQARKGLREHGDPSLIYGIVFVAHHEHADAPDAVALLRARRHWPRSRTPEPRDELPPSHPRSSALDRGGAYPCPCGMETALLPSRRRAAPPSA